MGLATNIRNVTDAIRELGSATPTVSTGGGGAQRGGGAQGGGLAPPAEAIDDQTRKLEQGNRDINQTLGELLRLSAATLPRIAATQTAGATRQGGGRGQRRKRRGIGEDRFGQQTIDLNNITTSRGNRIREFD